MTPEEFANEMRAIVAKHSGHEAHRLLDLATNDVLRALGYGEGVDIFEREVAKWHEAAHPYPYRGPCPNCETP